MTIRSGMIFVSLYSPTISPTFMVLVSLSPLYSGRPGLMIVAIW